jgi:hypothetical protein
LRIENKETSILISIFQESTPKLIAEPHKNYKKPEKRNKSKNQPKNSVIHSLIGYVVIRVKTLTMMEK